VAGAVFAAEGRAGGVGGDAGVAVAAGGDFEAAGGEVGGEDGGG